MYASSPPAGRSNSAPTSPTASTAALPGRLSTATSATETRPGTKVGVESATYDFGYGLRHFNWGGQFGAEWQAYRHLSVYADLTCAANSIFKKDFHSVSFDMYNLYFTIGFGYRF